MAREITPEELLRLMNQTDWQRHPDLVRAVQGAALAPNATLRTTVARAVAGRAATDRLHPFPTPSITSSLQVGQTPIGRPVGIEIDDLTKHLLAVGQSGAGKTTLFYNLLTQLDVPCWSFDLKQDYRHLVHENEDLLVLPWTELRFNPLKPPPGVAPRRWAQVCSEIFGHATALLSGSKNFFLTKLLKAYKLFNLFEELGPPYPSFHDFERVMTADTLNYVRKSSNYRETVLNRVVAMNRSAGTIFDCSEGFPIDDLLTRDVVFEFDGLNRDVQNFLMEILLAYVYEYRVAHTERDTGLRHVTVVDEGKRLFSVYKERQDAAGIPAIDELTARLREFGEGLLVADQEASKLTESLKANTYTKVLLPTGDRTQFEAVADAMQLTAHQREAAQTLDVGEAILQVGNRDPVRVALPATSIPKDVTDRDLQRHQADAWNALSHTPRETTSRFDRAIGASSLNSESEPDVLDDPTDTVDLSPGAERLLRDVVEEPFKPLLDRYERFSSRGKGFQVKSELIDAGLVVERGVREGGSHRKLLELTSTGREYVEDALELDPGPEDRGGVVHRYWQAQIQQQFEDAGWTADTEVHDADVYATNGEIEVAVEVAMRDTQREVDHVKRRLDAGIDRVWVACPTREILDGVSERLAGAGLLDERVALHRLHDLPDVETLES